MSWAVVTSWAVRSRISMFGALERGWVASPGTAITGRPIAVVQVVVLRAPDRAAASPITVPRASAAMIRFLARKV